MEHRPCLLAVLWLLWRGRLLLLRHKLGLEVLGR